MNRNKCNKKSFFAPVYLIVTPH